MRIALIALSLVVGLFASLALTYELSGKARFRQAKARLCAEYHQTQEMLFKVPSEYLR